MLPSQGLFKDIPCPYFNANDCLRPFCHFNHKKDQNGSTANSAEASKTQNTEPKVPVYKPTPKLLALPLPPLIQKRKTLEYRPDQPGMNSRSKSSTSETQTYVPTYIPAPTNDTSTSIASILDTKDDNKDDKKNDESKTDVDLDDFKEEFDEIDEIISDQLADSIVKAGAKVVIEISDDESPKFVSKEPENAQKPIKIVSVWSASNGTDEIFDKSLKSATNEYTKPKSEEKNDKDGQSSRERKSSGSDKKDREKNKSKDDSRSYSSSHSSKHKSSSHKSSREKHKEKVRDKDHDKDKNKDKVKDRDRDRDRDTDKSKEKNSSSKSSSSSKRHHSSSSKSTASKSSSHRDSASTSSSSKSKLKTDENTEKKINIEISTCTPISDEPMKVEDNLDAMFATTTEEIMAECAMVYKQFEQEQALKNKNNSTEEQNHKELKRKIPEDVEIDDSSLPVQKKRIAYEKAEEKHRDLKSTKFVGKPNHLLNARQAIFNRQMDARKKEEEAAAAAQVAIRDAEEKVRKAHEELRLVQEKKLTPLIPKSYLTPSIPNRARSIAPVSNIIALERAKKKVEELKAEKSAHSFTPAQSLKGVGRVAHKPTTTTTTTTAPTTEIKIEPDVQQRKPPVLEANSTKIYFNLRMQYYEKMVQHCMTIYRNIADAWERAQAEELAVFKKCNTPIIYKSSALLAINKLRKEAADAGNKTTDYNKLLSHEVILAGKLATNSHWSIEKRSKPDLALGSGEPFDKLTATKAYDIVYSLRLTDEQLISNGYPRPGKRPGLAVIHATRRKNIRRQNGDERYCTRCGAIYNISMYDEICVDECNYHPKGAGYMRGFADNHHRCCQQPAGTPGCTYGNYHVFDYVDLDNLNGYVATIDKSADYVLTKKDIYALDCEMCYTTEGIELTRVTVVDINARTVYDALVKPANKIVDYNTIYSGITEEILANETRSLRDVQAVLLSMFHSRTVLVGHSLESDLKALKIIHNVVVDTSVLFPHKMGPPKKRALKTLCIENLKRIIQENESGHNSAEDAEVCIQLIKFYLRNKIS